MGSEQNEAEHPVAAWLIIGAAGIEFIFELLNTILSITKCTVLRILMKKF